MNETLLFVYNADRGLFNALTASAHKLISPTTYACALCRHTFGRTGMLEPWKSYLELQSMPVAFTYRDEFRREHPDWENFTLPTVLIVESDETMHVLLDAETMQKVDSLTTLISLLEDRLGREEDSLNANE